MSVELTEEIAAARREAWSEGYVACWRDEESGAGYGTPNPYGDPFAPQAQA